MKTLLTMPTADAPMMAPLLRPEFPTNDVRCLPFVRDLRRDELSSPGEKRRLFWDARVTGNYQSDTELGYSYAAAYMRFLQLNRDADWGALLGWILSDMPPRRESPSAFVETGFTYGLSRYLLSTAGLMSGRDLEHDLTKTVLTMRGIGARLEMLEA